MESIGGSRNFHVTILRLHNRFKIKVLILALIFFCCGQTSAICENLSAGNEDGLLALFIAGKTDSIRNITEQLPEETAAGQFFRGIFENDGEAARFYYDRIVALYPESEYEAYALDRLWQYHMAKGDLEMAERYWGFLKRRHPDHQGTVDSPDPLSIQDLRELSAKSVHHISNTSPDNSKSVDQWTLQLGAFQNPKGAQKVGQTAQKWGDVRFIKKVFKGKELTVVQVGLFNDREKAVNLDESIRASTDLRGRIVKVEK